MNMDTVVAVDDLPEGSSAFASFSSDMDYSLLASAMQTFLNISSGGKSLTKKLSSNSQMCSNSYNGSKKERTRNCAYLEDIDVHKCPLCPASFNAKDGLAKHALRIHHKAVVVLLQDGSTQKHLKCRFCVHKVMHRHQKLLLLHLEKKHAMEFVSFFKQSYLPSTLSSGSSRKTEVSQGRPAVCNLQEGFESMSLSNFVQSNIEDDGNSCALLDMPENNYKFFDTSSRKPESLEGSLFRYSKGSDLVPSSKNLGNQLISNSFAKRKLVLDGSIDYRVSKEPLMKENIPPKEALTATLARSGWKHAAGKPFVCGRCKEAFSCNALLLNHVSGRHRGPLRLLQPLFTCGLCSASFYKNSFLVRHCYQHHTPK